MAEVKHLTCSMTRANKILSAIKETKSTSKKDRYRFTDPATYGINVTFANYSESDVRRKIEDIREKVAEETLKRRLIAKIKNRLFSLNVRYGISDIMTELEVLRAERQKLNEIFEDCSKHNYLTQDTVKTRMDLFTSSEHKYDMTWDVGAFDASDIKSQIKALTKRIGSLDEKRDQLNIQNSFTLELTPEEYAMLDLD